MANIAGRYVIAIGDVAEQIAIIDRATGLVMGNVNGQYPLDGPGTSFTGDPVIIEPNGSALSGVRGGAAVDADGNIWTLIQNHTGTSPAKLTKISVTQPTDTTAYPIFGETDFDIAVASFLGLTGINALIYCSDDDTLLFAAGTTLYKINCSDGTLSGTTLVTPDTQSIAAISKVVSNALVVCTGQHHYVVDASALTVTTTKTLADFGMTASAVMVEWDGTDAFIIADDGHLYRLYLGTDAKVDILATASGGSMQWDLDNDRIVLAVASTIRSIDTTTNIADSAVALSFSMGSTLGIDQDGNAWVGDYPLLNTQAKVYKLDPTNSFSVLLSAGASSGEFKSPRARTFAMLDMEPTVPEVPDEDAPTVIPAPVAIEEPCEEDPQIMLRWSDDGGHTWSSEQKVSLGKVGQFKTRVIFRRLGRSRDRVYEVKVSDPCKTRIISAFLDVSEGRS